MLAMILLAGLIGPGQMSDCPGWTVLPRGDVVCDTGGAGILAQRPGHEPTIRLYESYEDVLPGWRFDQGFSRALVLDEDQRLHGPAPHDGDCKDALWLVVRDAIDVLSGRDLRIKPTLQRAAEACE